MSKYLSRKLKFISVFAMAAVVFIHSYNFKDEFLTPTTRISEGFSFPAMFEYFFSNELFRFAVPLFFAISGFLFYFRYVNTVRCYLSKLKKRLYTLLLPYVIWVVLSGVLLTVLSQFELFAGLGIVKEKAFDWAHFYWYFVSPAAFPLWYIQQLMLFSIISPLIYLLIKYTKGFILIPFGIMWLFNFHFIIDTQGLFYFSCGAALAIFGVSRNITRRDDNASAVSMTIIWVLLSLANTFLAVFADNSDFMSMVMLILYKVNEIVGVVAMWLIFDHIAKLITDKKGFIIAQTHLFFVFALHEPLTHLANQFALSESSGSLSHLALFVCLPFSIMAFCVMLSMMMRKNIRPVHRLMTGGR